MFSDLFRDQASGMIDLSLYFCITQKMFYTYLTLADVSASQ